MRISTNMSLDNFIYQQQQLLAGFFDDQVKLSTGRNITLPSDDPIQATRLLQLTEVEESQSQILANIRFAGDFLNASDAALTDITDSLIRVQELASGAVGSLSLPAERQAAAIEIDSILQQLVGAANRQFLGLYVFGGRDVKTQPVLSEFDGIRYAGDSGSLNARLSFDGDEEFSLSADDVFGMLSQRVQGSVDLDPAVTLRTRLDELNGANLQGIRLGSLRFVEDGSAGSYVVDLSSATSIGGIIGLINSAAQQAGSTLVASLNTAGNGILITPGDDVTISAVDNGVVAADLGIVTNVPTAGPIEGADLQRRVTHSTPLADLFGGAGLDLAGETFTIINGSRRASIDLSPAQTVQDVINAINNASIGVRASVNEGGTGIDVFNEVSGSLMSITEDGGTAAATLGIRTLNTTTSLSDLNAGDGVRRVEGEDDFEIVALEGTRFAVNVDAAQTVSDVIDIINAAATDAGVAVTAELSDTQNGIRLVDATGGGGTLRVNRLNFSEAAGDLGIEGAAEPAATELTGTDVGAIRVDGVFSSLIELRDALLAGEERDITRAAQRIDSALDEITRTQGMLGAQVRSMESRSDQTQQAVEATSVLLSQVRDLDYAEAIARFQQTQTALQASLLASGQSLNLTLLNFLT